MTPRIARVLVVALATTLAATSLGCGLISQAKKLVDNAQVLSDFADRLGKADKLTFTADYNVTDGDPVKLVQKPPNQAFIAKDSRFIFTADALFFCDTEQGVLTCQKTPNQSSTMDTADSNLVAGAAGPGFVTPEFALAIILAASIVPGAKVTQSEKSIAGQSTKCASATGLEAAADSGDKDAPKEFTVCVTDAGVLASFTGTSISGEKKGIEMTKYSTSADEGAFAPPAGAKVVDVTTIQPTP